VIRRWRHHGRDRKQFIEEAVQELVGDLMERPQQLLEPFAGGQKSLEEFLTRLLGQRADALLEDDRCRHRHERGVPADEKEVHHAAETTIEDQAERLEPSLTAGEQEFMGELLARRLSDA